MTDEPRWADRLLPRGTKRRQAARVGAQVAHDVRAYGGRLRGLWSAADDAAAAASGHVAPPGSFPGVRVVRVPGRGPLPDGAPDDLLIFVEPGDEPAAELEAALAAHGWDDPGLVLLTWDEEVAGTRRYRPSWSPEALLGEPLYGRCFAVRRSAVDAVGGLRDRIGTTPLRDACWWDLLLRVGAGLDPSSVRHLPEVLTRRATGPRVTPEAARAVVADHLGPGPTVAWEPTAAGGTVRIHWPLPDPAPHVSVIVPTRHNRTLMEPMLRGLARTAYPSFDVIVVDNGERTDDNESWYTDRATALGLDLSVRWWDQPFNYSAVNNAAAAGARGEVLVFCNDDTEALEPGWLAELVGWSLRPDIGLVGTHLLAADGTLQHAGVVVGLNGYADHPFEGLPPDTTTVFGPTRTYRNWLAVTAACVAVRRPVFDELGGFDERFVLCGSDVALGLAAVEAGYRNVCTPFAKVRHAESATRGGSPVPGCDFFTSWWPYARWLRAGDPYWSPALSLRSREPMARVPGEVSPLSTVGAMVGRSVLPGAGGWDAEAHARWLVRRCNASDDTVAAVRALHEANAEPVEPRTVAWWLPDLESPFYGGVNTALRLADWLARVHGVENRFVVAADPNEWWFRSAFAAAFPSLADAPITFIDGPDAVAQAPEVDVAIATLWETAYLVARAPGARRKAYLVQDIETVFSPAGTKMALADESYRLGLQVLANTGHVLEVAEERFGASGSAFWPAVDRSVFHPEGRRPYDHDGPVTVFVYARPGHDRNCWELASEALAELKARLGTGVRIVTAGSWATQADLGSGITHLGFLDVASTGRLYRTCDLGLTLQVSEHPSYLPLELLACGVPVVAFDHPSGDWLLRHDENSLRCRKALDGLVGALARLAGDAALRARLGAQGADDMATRFGDWDAALAPVWDALCAPPPTSPG